MTLFLPYGRTNTIMIHKYSLNGYNIILDVYSGAVHVVDDLTYRLVDFTDENMTEHAPAQAYEALCGFAREDIDTAYSELYEAFGMGQLHAADDYEQFADMMVNASVKSMCLNISHDCNLACEYCFASKGGFGGERCLMSEETARKAIDFLIERSVGRRNLEVDFFGGEPLMNFDVVKKTVEYARGKEAEYGKNFRFTITTNGLLLDDDKIDLSTARCTTACFPSTGARRSTTVSASTGAARAATTGSCPNSKN